MCKGKKHLKKGTISVRRNQEGTFQIITYQEIHEMLEINLLNKSILGTPVQTKIFSTHTAV